MLVQVKENGGLNYNCGAADRKRRCIGCIFQRELYEFKFDIDFSL